MARATIGDGERYATEVAARGHTIVTDTVNRGVGGDTGMTPHELVDAALAACIAMTVRIAADVRSTPLDEVSVDVTHVERDDGSYFLAELTLTGELTDRERAGLVRVAHHCPVSKMLSAPIKIGIVELTPTLTEADLAPQH